MAEDYPLEQLSDRAFEQLTVALSLAVLGPGVQAFGAGSDGGREATYTGPVSWSQTTGMGSDSWNGYVVVQAKQKQFPDADPGKNAAWLRGQIKDELDRWLDPESRRGKFPGYLIIVTNVRLSSTAGTGGLDRLTEYLDRRHTDSLSDRGFKGWKIWHRDQLNALLTVHEGIRHAFPAMLTVGDVISRMNDLSSRLPNPAQLHESLVAHAKPALLGERWVSFSEAGGDNRDSVENVMIDLPVRTHSGEHGFALRTLLQQSEFVLRKSMNSTGLPRHVVLTGAPGNGKSTLSRFLVQTYRSAFVGMDPVFASVQEVIGGTQGALRRLTLAQPKNKRWPIKVNLAEYADAIGPNGDKSLVRWISESVSKRSDTSVDPAALNSWLRVWPWIAVLDGLDEVTSPEVRQRVLDEIELFVEYADTLDADLFVVVTTRPTGYTERIAPREFTQLDLGYLEPSKAIEYGSLVIQRRLSDDHERLDAAMARFRKAARDPNAERLIKTPLQVLILTFILERLGALPADRYHLFWRYYETVYDREAAKSTSLTSLFAQHRGDITELHERAGLLLQAHAETLGEAKARMPLSILGTLAMERMIEVGHDPNGQARKIAERIVQAATQRLVLLVASEDNTVSFEVRSLQELMAARAISSGSEEVVRERLKITAASPHWRNSWVFVAGRRYSEGGDHDRDFIAGIVSTIDDTGNLPGWLCPIGPELAADILDDGLAATKPKWQRRFVDASLETLHGWIPRDVRGLALGLTAAAEDPNLRTHIRSRLKQALVGAPKSAAVAQTIMNEGELGGAAPHVPRKYAETLPGARPEEHPSQVRVGNLLEEGLSEIEIQPKTQSLILECLTELRKLELVELPDTLVPVQPDVSETFPKTLAAFADEEASIVLELLCGQLSPHHWQAQALLARVMWPSFTREAVGPRINLDFKNPWPLA